MDERKEVEPLVKPWEGEFDGDDSEGMDDEAVRILLETMRLGRDVRP
jgi:hypothetical protein